MVRRSPAPSLRELSSECETEGVSSDGSSMPTIYTPAHMNSEIFERLRSSGYTPSASLRSAAPSEREPGGVRTIHPATQKPQRCGRFSSPLRRLGRFWFLPFNERHSLSHARWACQLPQRGSREGAYHSTCHSQTATFRAIFIAPTKLKSFYIPPFIGGHSLKSRTGRRYTAGASARWLHTSACSWRGCPRG